MEVTDEVYASTFQHFSIDAVCDVRHRVTTSVRTGLGPGPLWSNVASVRSWNIFWTGLGPCAALALSFLFISYKPHFTYPVSDKKEST